MSRVNIPPPATHDWRPERKDNVTKPLESMIHQLHGRGRKLFGSRRRWKSMVADIDSREGFFMALSTGSIQQELVALRQRLHDEGLTRAGSVESFALIREMSRRVLDMRHYGSQLEGGLVMLQGMVAEMETGEGKTLTATLTAATVALSGMPVHVISVNDYLTERDAAAMKPLYQALGLNVGCVVHGQTPEQRREAYLADITYATNKELVFDYLRDRLTLAERLDPLLLHSESLHGRSHRTKHLLLRGLHFAIVDEADSILIDEARTPLILSGGQGGDEERRFLEQALSLARQLIAGDDFIIDQARRQLRLSESGRARVESEAQKLGSLWNGLVRRESTIQQALTALHFFHRDEQYLLRDGKVQIVDEFTGRVMEDRSWEQGLHQMIELKEGCELTQRREALAKISYQRFFRRYLNLAGMTGTAREVAAEFWSVYHLETRRVATHRPVIRKELPGRIYPDCDKKWQQVVSRIIQVHDQGQPVLVGTRSVATSEYLSSLVKQSGLAHQVLNAKQDAEEANIVSRAGEAGSITIATNMAGRGTDIGLGTTVKEKGGMHVIITERHEAARIDRQLAGRCGRQGDPGSFEAILSFDDFLFEGRTKGPLLRLVQRLTGFNSGIAQYLGRWMTNRLQRQVERYHARIRKELFRQDQAQGSLLSFSGRLE